MPDEIEKTEQPDPDDVLAAIQSFNDPTIITNMFTTLGWSYSMEIRETLMMAKQNANLSIKFKAIKHLRELLREAAEAAGYVANVSSTIPNPQGGSTTFSAKRIANILNPTKQINSIELKGEQNDQIEETNLNRECNRGQSQESQDTGRAFPSDSQGEICSGNPPSPGNTEPGGLEPSDRDEIPGRIRPDDNDPEGNPCIKTRPPTCDHTLYPGISSAEE